MSRNAILMISCAVNFASGLGMIAAAIIEELTGLAIPMPYKVVIGIVAVLHLMTNYVLIREKWWASDE